MSSKNLTAFMLYGWILWLSSVFLSFLFFNQSILQPASITSGYFIGCFLLTPELSFCSTKSGSDVIKFWSFLGCFWKFYRSFFKNKSTWSHGYVVGVFLQISYIIVCIFIIYSILYMTISLFAYPLLAPPRTVFINLGVLVSRHLGSLTFLVMGIVCGNSLHLINEKKELLEL